MGLTVKMTSFAVRLLPAWLLAICLFSAPLWAQQDGTVDGSFSHLNGADDAVLAVAVQPDDKVLIGGRFRHYDGLGREQLARLHSSGQVDLSFDPGQVAGSGDVTALALQSDGKILIGGSFAYNNNGVRCYGLARLTSDGSLDATFYPGTGIDGGSDEVFSVALQSDGKVLVGGNFLSFDGVYCGGIARLHANGSVDSTFSAPAGWVKDLVIQPDGKIIIVGSFSTIGGVTRNNIARLNADGSLDTSFDPGTGPNGHVDDVALQPDGNVVITGGFGWFSGYPRNGIARLHANGSVDTSFDPGAGADDLIRDLLVQPDGKILIVGNFDSYNGATAKQVARLEVNGSRDTSFFEYLFANSMVESLELMSDGRIMICGWFTSVGGGAYDRIARLHNSLDDTPPQFTSTPVTTGTVGDTYSYAITTTGVPTPTLSASGLPGWLTFDANSGLLTGTPATEGTYGPITITASNGVSPDAVQTLSVDVSAAPGGGGNGTSTGSGSSDSGGGGCSASVRTWGLPLGLILAFVVLVAMRKRRRVV